MTEANVAGRHLREVAPESVLLPEVPPGERIERRRAGRRQSRELLVTLVVLVAMLVGTVVVLLGEWRGGSSPAQPGQPAQSGAPALHAVRIGAAAGSA